MGIYGVRRFGFILAVFFVGVLIGGNLSSLLIAVFGALCALWLILLDDAKASIARNKYYQEVDYDEI